MTIMPPIRRVYHPYWKWEECESNMWGSVDDRDSYLKMAIIFTGNNVLYGQYMDKVIEDWPFSCEHNLTALDQNRRAWIGHAACAMAFGCPEDIVREAWHHLTDEQRILANNQADMSIRLWERRNIGNYVSQKEFTF